MKLFIVYKESRIIHGIIDNIKEIIGNCFTGRDVEFSGVDMTIVEYIVTDDERVSDLEVGDILPEGLTDHSQDYITVAPEEQLGNLLMDSAKDKVTISQLEDAVGNLLLEVALLKGGAV